MKPGWIGLGVWNLRDLGIISASLIVAKAEVWACGLCIGNWGIGIIHRRPRTEGPA